MDFFYTLNREKREMVYLVQGKSLLFDLFKAFDSDIFLYFSSKIPIMLHACATCSELPSNVSTMIYIIVFCLYLLLPNPQGKPQKNISLVVRPLRF